MTNPTACREQFEKLVDEWCAAIACNGSLSAVAAAEIKAAWNTRPDSGEAVAWMTHHEKPMVFTSLDEAFQYCSDDEKPIPLCAQSPSPDLSAITALVGSVITRLRLPAPNRPSAHDLADELQAALTQVGGEANEIDEAMKADFAQMVETKKDAMRYALVLESSAKEVYRLSGLSMDEAKRLIREGHDAALRGDRS